MTRSIATIWCYLFYKFTRKSTDQNRTLFTLDMKPGGLLVLPYRLTRQLEGPLHAYILWVKVTVRQVLLMVYCASSSCGFSDFQVGKIGGSTCHTCIWSYHVWTVCGVAWLSLKQMTFHTLYNQVFHLHCVWTSHDHQGLASYKILSHNRCRHNFALHVVLLCELKEYALLET